MQIANQTFNQICFNFELLSKNKFEFLLFWEDYKWVGCWHFFLHWHHRNVTADKTNHLGDPSIPHIAFPFYFEAFINIKVPDSLRRGILILCHTYK